MRVRVQSLRWVLGGVALAKCWGMRIAQLSFLSVVVALGCGDDDSPDSDAGTDAASDTAADVVTTDAGDDPDAGESACPTDIWAGIDDYELEGELVDCPADVDVAGSLFNLNGIEIDNNGTAMTPCIEARCDDTYVYVATNKLPHYDFVQTTPNELAENVVIYRVPRTPAQLGEAAAAPDVTTFMGCVDGYEQYINNPDNATANEPSGLCANAGETLYYEMLSTGRVDYRGIACLGTAAFVISGVSANGPNEAGFPDPWGNPAAFYPDDGDDALRALDLCGGHTGGDMHYHVVAPACFERAANGSPANSYVDAAEVWNAEEFLTGDCTEESPIVGWSLDGYPIKGPCVCVTRDGDGTCTDVRRAYSSWIYRGLGAWEAESDVAAGDALTLEGIDCTTDADCDDENFACSWALSEVDGEVVARNQCVLVDYGWCSHTYVDRTDDDRTDIAFLDRCNGVEGADGYAYHVTMSFPYIQGCYRGTPAEQAMGGGMMGGGMMAMDVMDCTDGMTEGCCGDGTCDGPETADNCAEDC